MNAEPLDRVRTAGWSMFCADGAGVVSKPAEGLGKMMTVIVNVFEAAGLTVPEKKAETMPLRTPNQTPLNSPLVIEAAGQRPRSFCNWAALSTRPPTLRQRSNHDSDLRGHASIGLSRSRTIWRTIRSR